MIVMSLDVSKGHVLEKIVNNLNWSDIEAKSNIQFVSYRNNNIIRLFENLSKW